MQDGDKMEKMEEIFDTVQLNLKTFSEEYPKEMEAFGKMMHAIEAAGALDVKQKELIAISLSIAHHCKWCIAYHVKMALRNGATKKEIMEASWMAVLMGGGPALMYMQLVEEAVNEFKE